VTSTVRSLARSTERIAARDRTVGVLVVDDSLVFRTGMSRAVQACDGLKLLGEADGGAAALEAIAELQPDLVILDLRMPGIDGLDVLRELRAQDPPPACRVLAISASIEDGIEEAVMAAGADGCLSKALTRAEICEVALRIVAE
jgi:two-component system, NarL family, nitrate/nitrite response regulator NarL